MAEHHERVRLKLDLVGFVADMRRAREAAHLLAEKLDTPQERDE